MRSAIVLVCIFAIAKAVDIDWAKANNLDGSPFLSQSKRNSSVQQRIIGGGEAAPHQFPHQAGLIIYTYDGNKYFCGGSMISKYYVITAAYFCCDNANSILVIMGAHRILENEPTKRYYDVPKEHIKIKEDYDSANIVNDICLLYIEEGIEETPGVIQSIDLPRLSDRDKNFALDSTKTCGWGRTTDVPGSTTSAVLKFANSIVLPQLLCNIRYLGGVQPTQICMESTGKSTCTGDSGGPLISTKNGQYVLIGITSYGILLCSITQPSVFTRVTSYIDWIDTNTQGTVVQP